MYDKEIFFYAISLVLVLFIALVMCSKKAYPSDVLNNKEVDAKLAFYGFKKVQDGEYVSDHKEKNIKETIIIKKNPNKEEYIVRYEVLLVIVNRVFYRQGSFKDINKFYNDIDQYLYYVRGLILEDIKEDIGKMEKRKDNSKKEKSHAI